MKHFLPLLLLLFVGRLAAQQPQYKVVTFDIRGEIAPSTTRLVSKAFLEAENVNANLIVIRMDTYGGLLADADSIRKTILNSKIPVFVLIDKNAASAGALISIACDKIFMAPGATIGSATVVHDDGKMAPDKYQSYMRSIMRSTAESHGKDTTIVDNDTVITFRRNPRIAEAMVDERISIPGIIDSGRIAAFTTSEAIKIGYCEAELSTVDEVLKYENTPEFEMVTVAESKLDKLIGFVSGPALRGVLLMFIFWGIFFELRSPGIGFALLVAVVAALLYFAPLYMDGLAANWEILLFVIGLVLIGLEIFVIPGFGVAGVAGIIFTLTGLILSLIRNVNFDFSNTSTTEINAALTIVFVSMVGFVIGIIVFGKGIMNSKLGNKMVLTTTLKGVNVGTGASEITDVSFIGTTGIAHTDIRPMGKIQIENQLITCKSAGEFISEGEKVKIVRKELGYWVVEKI